ncbi:cell division protein SepF [Actinospongicola halichondriae]|uniref:cell division protein SepF n=1 Tax=Actinospongicola halichondriae TaxID=3236844 RepID=UPI003D5B2496
MAGVLNKAMVWLGLAPDDEYDDYPYEAPGRPGGGASRPGYGAPSDPRGAPERRPGPGAPGPARRPQPRTGPGPADEYDDPYLAPRPSRSPGTVRQLPAQGALQNDPRSPRVEETPTVRAMRPTSARPSVTKPESFDDAKEIADRFKADQPVVMDLAGLDKELSRRLIDFASGICYALGGNMERVRPGGYLLTPARVEVSEDDKRRLASNGA